MTAHDDAEKHRLLALVEQLQRDGRSQREIEAALREVTGDRPVPQRSVDVLLARFTPLRLWA